MLRPARALLGVLIAMVTLGAPAARASFHLMQIEQIIGGVNGDTTAQAIQLRMRSSFQNQVQNARIFVRDAAGLNPVLIATFSGPVANTAQGARVLITSTNFNARCSPAAVPDATMQNLIPASYLSAGSLTFEDNFGTIYWRVSWGGTGYTGSHLGSVTNDADGNFGPGVASALPSTTRSALRFPGSATALSTNNLADYSITGGAATFNNNAGTTNFVVQNSTNPTGVGSANPAQVYPGGSSTFTVNVTPGTFPASTGLSVTMNLTPIGGAQVETFSGAGNVFTFAATVSAAAVPSTYILNGTVQDAQGRSSPVSLTLQVLCRADFDQQGGVNSNDVSAFLNQWFNDQANGTLVADFNHDGESNSNDVSAFLDRWFADIIAGC